MCTDVPADQEKNLYLPATFEIFAVFISSKPHFDAKNNPEP